MATATALIPFARDLQPARPARAARAEGGLAHPAEPCDRHLRLYGLVSELMADDLSLAEQLRAAITALWLAAQRTRGEDLTARRDLQRAEELLRLRLYRAMRGGALSSERFDEAMALLRPPGAGRGAAPRAASQGAAQTGR